MSVFSSSNCLVCKCFPNARVSRETNGTPLLSPRWPDGLVTFTVWPLHNQAGCAQDAPENTHFWEESCLFDRQTCQDLSWSCSLSNRYFQPLPEPRNPMTRRRQLRRWDENRFVKRAWFILFYFCTWFFPWFVYLLSFELFNKNYRNQVFILCAGELDGRELCHLEIKVRTHFLTNTSLL